MSKKNKKLNKKLDKLELVRMPLLVEAREYEPLKQGYTISETVDKIIQEFDLNISRKKLYSQIH